MTRILEALEGDYQTALEHVAVYREEYGDGYARCLAALLTPQRNRPVIRWARSDEGALFACP